MGCDTGRPDVSSLVATMFDGDPSHEYGGARLVGLATAATSPPPRPHDWPPGAISMACVEDFFGAAIARRLLVEMGLLDAPAAGPPAFITRRDFWQLCLKNINLADDEGHGCTPRILPKSTWQMIFSGVNQMDTVGDGLRHFCDLAQAARTGVAVTVGYGRNGVHLNYMASPEAHIGPRFERYLELIALVFHCVLIWLTGRQFRPVQVRLSSLLEDQDGSLLSGLCVASPMRQGQGFTMVYDREDMALPLGVRKYQHWSHETNAFEELCVASANDAEVADAPVVERVRRLVASKGLSLQEVAPSMGMSSATLQRRLREAGTSFREIMRDLRRERLIALLATDIDFDDVAEELGLSERRSLWRVCQDWLGVSPSEYRRTHRRELRSDLAPA
ncbi:MAG: AraC family transcriptional regulator [Phenylobacterium sp.]|uniref:helix-turn-helix transcriptional regulator n=1 Tax=Phenylobacterium sp. TaxID=1871053 RepID=UPI00122A1CCD|nr:AraC family transcriptional regulator [Phenylobacterium sp.]TAJ68876.1 MAG: AraC family transcriptional regulator [Phenylobacterium sp.]